MADVLEAAVADAAQRVRFRHRRTRATTVTPGSADAWCVTCDDGTLLTADSVALCFGHAAPAAPCAVAGDVACHPKFVPNPWARDALAGITADNTVLIVGTGLTMADVAMSLRARGHAGPVTAVSRRGLLPRGHGAFVSDLDLFRDRPPPRTAPGLLRFLRRRARDEPLGWHAVVDSLRAVLPEVWTALPASEKRRVVRRLLPFWDIHRFRIAPQIDAALRQARAEGWLTIEKAGLAGLASRDGRFVASLKRPDGAPAALTVDAVVLCTGPARDLGAHPLVASLMSRGLARYDDAGLGLAVDRQSRVLSAAGHTRSGLLAFGPMTRGSFGEMTGAPDITRHIETVVGDLLNPPSGSAENTGFIHRCSDLSIENGPCKSSF